MKNARLQFEQGHHRDVVDQIAAPGRTREESTALIGSLAFLGRLEEAVGIFKLRSAQLTSTERSRARFALALAYTRISKFKSARRWLRESLSESRTQADTFQGLAVYHYYLGNFEKAASNARQALNLAIAQKDSYVHAFAIDLYGHALVQTGQRSAGLAKLTQARELSRGKADPYTPAILIYEAEAGLRAKTIVREIEEQIGNLLTEDTYTKANLILELARQLTLRGQWSRARAELDGVSPLIYGFQNRRQEVVLQLRLAELSYRQGDIANATHFVQSARRIADLVYADRVSGLEAKLAKAAGTATTHASAVVTAQPSSTLNTSGASISARIRARADGYRIVSAGDDPLGDLLDRVSQDPRENADELLNAGYLGLWPEAYSLKAGASTLVILDDLRWVAVSRDGVRASADSLSPISYKILKLLAQRTATKEQLVRSVWNYEYDPSRHDSMIYAALAALRKSLVDVGFWIETQDEGWALRNRGASVSFVDRETTVLEKPAQQVESVTSDLNWRQLKAMTRIKANEPWTVPRYKENFDVSTMTAWRDLDLLAKAGYLTRIGRGRATVYLHAKALESV
jgi:Tfp pilus assembly protein PilF